MIFSSSSPAQLRSGWRRRAHPPCRRQRTSTISSSTTSSRSSFASAESALAPPRPRRRTVPLGACSITLHSLMGSSEAWLPRSSS